MCNQILTLCHDPVRLNRRNWLVLPEQQRVVLLMREVDALSDDVVVDALEICCGPALSRGTGEEARAERAGSAGCLRLVTPNWNCES